MSIQQTKFLANVLFGKLAHGQRTTLVEARAMFPSWTREMFDVAALHLQADGRVALYHEDRPDTRPALEAGAISVASTKYHLLYRTAR